MNLKDILSFRKLKKTESSTSNCHKSIGIISYVIINWRVRLVVEFTWLVVTCLVALIIYFKNSGDQYVGSATHFTTRSRIHKTDIKAKKDRCVTSRRFSNKWCDSNNSHIFFQPYLIEPVQRCKVSYGKGKLCQ